LVPHGLVARELFAPSATATTYERKDKTDMFSATISGSGDAINVSLGSGSILPRGKTLSLGDNAAKIRSLYGLSELNPNIANAC
jgi:hypothetical protein